MDLSSHKLYPSPQTPLPSLSLPLECPRGHELRDQHQHLSVLLVPCASDLPGVIETQDIRVLQCLQDGHLLLEPSLLRLVVPVLLQMCACMEVYMYILHMVGIPQGFLPLTCPLTVT